MASNPTEIASSTYNPSEKQKAAGTKKKNKS